MSETAVSNLAKVAKEWGIFAAMCAFFIYQSWIRENGLAARIEAQDTFIRETLVSTLSANTEAFLEIKTLVSAIKRDRDHTN